MPRISNPEEPDGLTRGVKPLSPREQVLRQQLNILAYAADRASGTDEDSGGEPARTELAVAHGGHGTRWRLLPGLSFHRWQEECRDKWFSGGRKGVIKVVTGAGKTVLACAIMEKLQNEQVPDLHVVIVVPTIVLLEQWYERLTASGTPPSSSVGRMGGGHSDALGGSVRILVCVLNSAASKLPRMTARLQTPLLMIVDECHRAGAEQMSQIFATRRDFSLGLSATPERDDDAADESYEPPPADQVPVTFDDSLLGKELGPIIYELDYRQALAAGILSRFTIHHYGLPLEPSERSRYERLSREITDTRRALQSQMKGRPMDGGALVGWARRVASRGGSALSRQAAEYVQLTGQRKLLLYHAHARGDAVLRLVTEALTQDADARIILFHESIAEVMRLFLLLRGAGCSVVAEHSQLPDSLREESVRLFRSGAAGVLVSARSLIEGFDVPAADMGIVVASSSSVRQRVQTLGRILRKKPGAAAGRVAVLHVLYMAETTDELIYEKEDWEKLTGAERNRYFTWDPTQAGVRPLERAEPPRRPKPTEAEVDWLTLKPGDAYPGAYEGAEYSCDSQGNVRDPQGRLVANGAGLPALVKDTRGGYGRFRVTPVKRAILVARQEGEGSQIVLAGFLPEALQIREGEDTKPSRAPGAVPPRGDDFVGAGGYVVEIRVQSKASGPVLAKKRSDGESYARTTRNATDLRRGQDAEAVVAAVLATGRQHGMKITRVKVEPATGTVFCELGGRRLFLYKLVAGLEFSDEVLAAP